MPKSDEAKALEAIARELGKLTQAVTDLRNEVRAARRDRISPGG